MLGVGASLSAVVREILLPIMKEIKNDLNSVKNDLSSLNKTVISLNDSMNTELMELDRNLQQNFRLLLNNSYGYIVSPPIHTCGGTGEWRRVVYLDMTNPNTTCPSGWRLTSHSRRTCGRLSTSGLSCDSVTFPVSGGNYTRVCGRIIGYQNESPDAFNAYNHAGVANIDGVYVDGVSLTYGSPRQHIWTFAAGVAEVPTSTTYRACPCDTAVNIITPPFVGEDYFCESGYNSGPWSHSEFYPNDPLWDGHGCTINSGCCSLNNPPYFTKQLPSSTNDDLEVRLCHDTHTEDTPIEFIELYVQ